MFHAIELTVSLVPPVASFYQFHHYYIYGKFSDCKEEKERMKNCFKWKMKKSEEAKVCDLYFSGGLCSCEFRI